MGSPKDKCNIEYPIQHLKDRLEFAKKIHETLDNPEKSKEWSNHIQLAKDKIHQYETAIQILMEHHNEEAGQ